MTTTSNVHGLVQFALSQVWAMKPEEHRRMMDILVRHENGVRFVGGRARGSDRAHEARARREHGPSTRRRASPRSRSTA
jgi:hypothetical protein